MINIPLSQYKKRKVSSFLAQEMLYDYLMNRLDSERRTAVEAELKNNLENQKSLAQMKQALNYIEKINRVEVSPEFLEDMTDSSNYISILLKKTQFDKWPSGVKWSIEALVVLFGIVLFLVVVPWDQALKMTLLPKDKEVILAEITKDPSEGKNINLAEVEKKETPQFQDDEKKTPPEVLTEKQDVAAVVVKNETKENKNEPLQAQTTAATQNVTVKTPEKTPAPAPKESTDAAVGAAEDSEKKSAGFLYRGQLQVTNVEMNSPKITEKIIELGGRKAGEVDIGWKKSDTTYYYHFTLPEAKYSELIAFLSEYAKTELTKEKHPRVMPDGIIRLIITLDEKKQ